MSRTQISVGMPLHVKIHKNIIKSFLKYALLYTILAIIILPIVTLILASLKSPLEISMGTPFSLPKSLYLDNFFNVIKEAHMLLAMGNSLLLACISIVFNIVLGSMTSYVLARYDFKLKKVIMSLFLFAMILPFFIIEIARFDIIRSLGFYNTMMAPIIIYVGTDMMQIFIYIQFIDKISYSMEESALVEGASFLYTFFRIIFPMLLPASATLGIIKFVEIVNDMYIPYLYMPSSKLAVLSTALMQFAGAKTMEWGSLCAAIIVVLAPTMIVYAIFQRFIIDGITAGSVKE